MDDVRFRSLIIEYDFKLGNLEYILGLDEQEDDPDMNHILRQRAIILVVKEFLSDLRVHSKLRL